MEFEKTASDYTIEVSKEDMLAILKAERTVYDATLCDKLEKIDGVSNVNYDGHFGAAIYLKLDTEHDNDATRHEITATIEATIAEYKTKLGGKILKVSE